MEQSAKNTPAPVTAERYAILFCSQTQQRLLDAGTRLHKEVTGIPHAVREPAVARAKLAWWRNEFANLSMGRASHPLSLAMVNAAPMGDHLNSLLTAIADGVEDRIYDRWPDSELSLPDHCFKALGAQMTLLATLLQAPETELDNAAREFASLVGAGIYLNSHGIACAAHGLASPLAQALPRSDREHGDTIRPVLAYASQLLGSARRLTGGKGLIYHHALLRIHHRLNRKALSRSRFAEGDAIRLNGFQMLAGAWLGAVAGASRKP